MERRANVRKCSWCWRNWEITVWVRRDSECPMHHRYQTCRDHGGIDCDGRDGCPGSIR